MAQRTLRTVQPTPAPEAVTQVPDVLPVVNPDEPTPAGVIEVVGGAPGAVVPASSADVPVTRTMSALPASSGLVGEWDQSDIRFPALKIVQGSGLLSQQYNVGTLLLGDDELLPPPDLKTPKPEHTFRFVPVSIEKQYRENLSQEQSAAGAIPRIVLSLAEVEALGGSTQRIGDQKPSWSASARVMLLAEQPAGSQHPGFVLEFDGKLYAPAIYYASGSGYTALAKPLFNAALTTLTVVERDEAGNPAKGSTGIVRRLPYLPKCFWAMKVVRKPFGDFSVFAPEIRLTREETSAELREYIDTLRG
jgi:hypothetical protein